MTAATRRVPRSTVSPTSPMRASESRTLGVMMPGVEARERWHGRDQDQAADDGPRQNRADEAETEDEADPVLDVVDAEGARHERERDGREDQDGIRSRPTRASSR